MSEPAALLAWLFARVWPWRGSGWRPGLSQWLYAAMKDAGLAVELLETRHVRDAFKAMPVKSDRNDCARDCPADAARLVPAGALQVAARAGGALPTARRPMSAGRISKIGDAGVRTALYGAAHIVLTRPVKGCGLKNWAARLAKRAGMKKAKVALAQAPGASPYRQIPPAHTAYSVWIPARLMMAP